MRQWRLTAQGEDGLRRMGETEAQVLVMTGPRPDGGMMDMGRPDMGPSGLDGGGLDGSVRPDSGDAGPSSTPANEFNACTSTRCHHGGLGLLLVLPMIFILRRRG